MPAQNLYDRIVDSPILVYPPISPESDPVDERKISQLYADLAHPPTRRRKGLLYFHIPFCSSRCAFCTYASLGKRYGDGMIEAYITPFYREIDAYAHTPYVQNLDIECIFIGGGSPSMLTEAQLEHFLMKVRDSFDISRVREYSMEFELRTMTEEKLRICREYGVTRISFGWQTFVPHIRRIMALVPTEDELRSKIGMLRKHGFSVNADLMFGMPEQTVADWENDVRRAIEEGFTGVDLFKTENVPPAPMFELSKRKGWTFLGPETKKEMFRYAIDKFTKAGYVQDSFQRLYHPEFPTSKLLYNKYRALASYDQVSMGPGAWGFIANRVYVNKVSTDDYIRYGADSTLGSHLGCTYELSPEEYVERNFVQGLSHNMKLAKDEIDGEIPSEYREVIERLKEHGLLEETEQEFRLTNEANGYVFNIAHEFFSRASKKKSLIFFMHQRHGRKGKKLTVAESLGSVP